MVVADPQALKEQLSYFEKKVLLTLEPLGKAAPEEVRSSGGFGELVEVMNAASWLKSKGLLKIHERAELRYSLQKGAGEREFPERVLIGLAAAAGGSIRVQAVKDGGRLTPEALSIALGWVRRKGWAELRKVEGDTEVVLTASGKAALDRPGPDEELVARLRTSKTLSEDEVSKEVIAQLKSRQDVLEERPVVHRTLELTDLGRQVLSLGLSLKEEVAQITPELLQTGRWREVELRKYDVGAFAPAIYGGRRHPMTVVVDEIRSIFLRMGFTEISGQYILSAFWNMDALFTAQDHPARDLQDTFYLKEPERQELKDRKLVAAVKAIHEDGGKTGSLGWRYKWSEAEASRLVLRTHTTPHTLAWLQDHRTPPVKVFMVGRVFRNEDLSYKSLPEFTQVEGIVMDEDANFDILCGLLREFYSQMGFPEIRIRPAYFPYTEPSAEVDILYQGRWMELGGAGVFRPEVTAPFNVPHPVLAWGLGVERLAMLRFGLSDIRQLYESDLEWLRNAPIG